MLNGRVTYAATFRDESTFGVCFVCTGNICRSPMAEAVLRDLAERHGLDANIRIVSAGISDYHVGEPADPRALAALRRHGYTASDHHAKQFEADWFDHFDLVIALDRGQSRALTSWAKDALSRSKVRTLMSFEPDAGAFDVPDPYYSDDAAFDRVLDQIESATGRLFGQIQPVLR